VKPKSIALSFVLLTTFYLMLMLFIDISGESITDLQKILKFLPLMMMVAYGTFLLRYIRWYWLLSSANYPVPFFQGFSFYLSGFALTTSPGKLGELIRIRYFQRVNVPPSIVISAFFYERIFDLLVVLALGLLAFFTFDFFPFVATVVISIVVCVLFLSKKPHCLKIINCFLRRLGMRRVARIGRVLIKGVSGIHLWLRPKTVLISLGLGLLAWLLLSFCFVWLLNLLNINLDFMVAMSVYPIAMLVGAISMVPGGIGSTETAVVLQLSHYGIPMVVAGIAAIAIRITTIWFAMFCGVISVIILETKTLKRNQ
jgi:uncharacterized protein (TIRG00374 family)